MEHGDFDSSGDSFERCDQGLVMMSRMTTAFKWKTLVKDNNNRMNVLIYPRPLKKIYPYLFYFTTSSWVLKHFMKEKMIIIIITTALSYKIVRV